MVGAAVGAADDPDRHARGYRRSVRHEQRLREALRARPLLADSLLAAALYLADVVLWFASPQTLHPTSWPLSLGFALIGAATVAIRRRWIWLAVAVLSAHTLAPFIGVGGLHTEGAAVMALTYTAAAYLPAPRAAFATAALWLPAVAVASLRYDDVGPFIGVPLLYFVVVNALAALVFFLIGRTVRHRRAYVAALEDRARTAELNQTAATVQAVADERRRIARELHDVVAHHVSVMGVLATGSRRMLARDPAATDEALATIEETGRTALREMRRLLDVLRTDQEPAGELAPQPGLAHVTGLVEQVREAGLPVRLVVEGDPGPLDPGVALTIYRVVQEALTNALKHAGTATAEVRLDFGRYWMTVEVSDTGRGPTLSGNRLGHGLLGMRERVSLYGGTLRTGPRPGGGYRVYAKIPVEALDGERVGDDGRTG